MIFFGRLTTTTRFACLPIERRVQFFLIGRLMPHLTHEIQLRFPLQLSHVLHAQLDVLVLPTPGLPMRHEYHVSEHTLTYGLLHSRLTAPDGALDTTQLVR